MKNTTISLILFLNSILLEYLILDPTYSSKYQLGEVPVAEQKFNPWTDDFFSNFESRKNLTPFPALNDQNYKSPSENTELFLFLFY